MGRPEPPSREQTRLLQQAAWATAQEYVRADDKGILALRRPIAPWSLVLIDQLNGTH